MPSESVVVNKVIVHPLVLLSVVDHFNRMGKIGNQKRVVGVLLGCWRQKGVLDVSNSFAGKFFTSLWIRMPDEPAFADAMQHGSGLIRV